MPCPSRYPGSERRLVGGHRHAVPSAFATGLAERAVDDEVIKTGAQLSGQHLTAEWRLGTSGGGRVSSPEAFGASHLMGELLLPG